MTAQDEEVTIEGLQAQIAELRTARHQERQKIVDVAQRYAGSTRGEGRICERCATRARNL